MPVIERYRNELEAADCEVSVAKVSERTEENELLGLLRDIDGVICGNERITAAVLEAAPQLKVISKWGASVDSIDLAACKKRGVKVRNTPNAFVDPVADTVLSWMLSFARKPSEQDGDVRAGRWQKAGMFSLSEKTLGIVGLGHIGRAVARRARGFGMTLFGCDPVRPPAAFLKETGLKLLPFDALLKKSDFVSLNCDLNSTSQGMMNAAAFSKMKLNSYLLNTARGALVVEKDLIATIRTGLIAGAALDVFEREPLPQESTLRLLPQIILSPHNSHGSRAAYERVHASTIRNLIAGLKKRR
jgi:D-3-phosphoglycerate dehydrogenase